MSREFSFFIYLLERYAEHLGVTADVAYRRLMDKNLVDYAVGMYELYHVEAIENAFADLDRRLSALINLKPQTGNERNHRESVNCT